MIWLATRQAHSACLPTEAGPSCLQGHGWGWLPLQKQHLHCSQCSSCLPVIKVCCVDADDPPGASWHRPSCDLSGQAQALHMHWTKGHCLARAAAGGSSSGSSSSSTQEHAAGSWTHQGRAGRLPHARPSLPAPACSAHGNTAAACSTHIHVHRPRHRHPHNLLLCIRRGVEHPLPSGDAPPPPDLQARGSAVDSFGCEAWAAGARSCALLRRRRRRRQGCLQQCCSSGQGQRAQRSTAPAQGQRRGSRRPAGTCWAVCPLGLPSWHSISQSCRAPL